MPEDYKTNPSGADTGQSTEFANQSQRQGAQGQNQGDQNQGGQSHSDESLGQDNGTVPKNETATDTTNLVGDDTDVEGDIENDNTDTDIQDATLDEDLEDNNVNSGALDTDIDDDDAGQPSGDNPDDLGEGAGV